MGMFSWKTQDTNRSICNTCSGRKTFVVYMTDNNGNQWEESEYEGYGEFGGKDFYELLAQMNDLNTREEGIGLAFSDKPHIQPNLTESGGPWKEEAPDSCEFQGYFYEEEECYI